MQIDEDIYLERVNTKRKTDQEVDAFLEHFGVKGMRWGIRNSSGKSGKERRAKNREFNKRYALKRTPTQKKNYRTRNIGSAGAGVAAFITAYKSGRSIPVSAVMAGTTSLITDSFIKSRQDRKLSNI